MKRIILHMLYRKELNHLKSRIEYLKKMRNKSSDQFTEDYYLARLDELLIVATAFYIIK
jgi:hypothetical protein